MGGTSSSPAADAAGSLPPTLAAERARYGNKRFTILNYGLRVILEGPEEAKMTVLFLHGMGGRAAQFKHQVDFLAERGLRVVAPDLPGAGESDKPTDSFDHYSAERLAGVCLAVYQLFCKGATVIVGHSYGCQHALRVMQTLHQEGKGKGSRMAVNGLVLIGASRHASQPPAIMLNLPVAVLELVRPMFRDASNRSLFHPDTERVVIASENEVTSLNPMFVIKGMVKGWVGPSMQQGIDQGIESYRGLEVQPSVLLLTGETDPITPVSGAEQLNKDLGGSATHKVVEGTSHNCMLERPAEVNRLLWEFIEPLLLTDKARGS
ncbi:unnamed protein product [Vitrella brassicaformis CCMP3155]|uniref:AB hydrolase-1 domain-containing protein n=1 Tax=Vitrella brassicaformis (strain CCMP3155) TaxID=1169540 RepID=A0A0G4F8P0_VITBC|nr:unnamed protein product [Vitrella brassicaformis CCMP3155]|eukprot:CEM09083.1 unnamed protein product [Vitrella brassicaformis CCMP3155]